MVTLRSTANGHAPAGRGASRAPALFAGLVFAAFAFAGTAEAADQGNGAQSPGGLTGPLGLVSQQSSQAAQAAVAQAAATQVQPVNIAITIAVNSPGASPVIVQSNGNSGGAGAGNSSSTTQSSGKPQQNDGKGSSAPSSGQSGNGSGGGASSGGGPSQQAPQSSQTVQGAGAQAAAMQFNPVNIAAPIAVNSPGASPVIVQTNGNSAGATAANSSSTAQTSGASQPAAPGAAAQPPQAQNGPLPPIVMPGTDFTALNSLLGPGTGSTSSWNWNWNWNLDLDIPWPQLPALPGWPSPGPSSADAPAHSPKEDPVNVGNAGRFAGGQDTSGWELSSGLESRSNVSSIFVQSPANVAEPALLPLVPLPRPALPAPPAGGAGFSPAGLILSALAALALYLISLGLLLRRLGLASAPWRHQAYLAPLQRPG